MGKKVFWNKKSKLILMSSILTSSLSLFVIPNLSDNTNNNYSLIESKTNNINSKATNFDYIPIANNVNSQPVSTSVGFLGINSSNNKLYLTSYEGVTVWEFDAINNSMVKEYYQKILGVNDISSYTLKSWKYIKNKDVIAMLLSDANKKNSTVFGINASTGLLFATNLDENKNPIPESNMVQVNDGVDVLWLNSADEIIASKFSYLDDYFWNTFTIRFEEDGVSLFRTPIRQISMVNLDDAKTLVRKKLAGGDIVDGKAYTHKDVGWESSEVQTGTNDVSKKTWELQALIEGEYGSNTNIGIFTNKNKYSTVTSYSKAVRDVYLQQAVLLDDQLNAIRDDNGNPIALTLNNPIAYNSASEGGYWQKASDLQKYGYKGTKVGTVQNFIWLTSGVWNAANQIAYDSSTKKITLVKQYDLQRSSDQDVYAYAYDSAKNRFFTTNTYTTSNTAIGYIDFDEAAISYKNLVSPATSSIKNPISFSPVIGNESILETPIVYYDSSDTSKIKGLYFKNGSQATTVDLVRKTYEDILTKIKTFDWYKTKATSSVSDEDLLNSLVFDNQPLNGSFTSKVVSKTSDDDNGTLNFKFETSYQNWWNDSTTSSFNIERTITGMYAKNNSSFSFVTTNTGNDENDEMLKKQIAFKETNFPSLVTYSDIAKYFALAKVKDVDNNVIDLTEDMVTLNADNVNGILSIKIDYSSKLPNGLSSDFLVYEQTFDGFKNLSDFSIKQLSQEEQNNNQMIVNFKQENFASIISKEQSLKKELLQNFFEISGYSIDVNDWDFTFDNIDDYTGILSGKLSYKNSDHFPESYKEISFSFSGFKKIPDQFKDVLVNSYEGYKKADDIWNEYSNSTEDKVSQTTLASLISVPYIDFKDLLITFNYSTNTELNLTINIKPNTTTKLKIGGTNLVLSESDLNKFKDSGISYPFKVSIPINTITQSFVLNKSDGQQIDLSSNKLDYINIDLNKESYEFIDSNKFANEITVDDIKQLYLSSGFVETVELQPNVQQGILYVTVSLSTFEQEAKSIVNQNNLVTSKDSNQDQNNALASGNGLVKIFEIKGFKKPSSPMILAISLTASGGAIMIAIALVVYITVIRRNLKKFLKDNQDPNAKYLKKHDPNKKLKPTKIKTTKK